MSAKTSIFTVDRAAAQARQARYEETVRLSRERFARGDMPVVTEIRYTEDPGADFSPCAWNRGR